MTPEQKLDAGFIAQQRDRLLKLRATLVDAARRSENDEGLLKGEGADGPREFEDEAQRLTTLELEGNRVVRDLARIEQVDRALKKIEDGTYGTSDLSGQTIPRERLEAVPESVYTLAEESARENKR